jgi:type 1 glutamine amidotransferase
MCVLGRPFGIRQLVYLGMNVLLMRDMTDSLYNPEMPPKVSHVRGTELVIEHIEEHWCPTITSTDFLDEPPFRFAVDTRPHVVFIVSDDHYGADNTIPVFAQWLRKEYNLHCSVLHGQGKADIPGMVTLRDADTAVVYVRRLGLPKEQIEELKTYVAKGGPIIGLRTASHAFKMNMRNPEGFVVPEGRAEWVEFDAEILGGSYSGHEGNDLKSIARPVKSQLDHPVMRGIPSEPWQSEGSLYNTHPVVEDATILMTGTVPDVEEPLTWVREGVPGRVFYTSLGHPEDFYEPAFIRLFTNAVFWSMGQPIPEP